ncbi:MAG: hypothetical protein R3C20_20850 [Planctomycetaceae bacterium]
MSPWEWRFDGRSIPADFGIDSDATVVRATVAAAFSKWGSGEEIGFCFEAI